MTEHIKIVIVSMIACGMIFASSKIRAQAYYQFVDAKGEVVLFIPQPNDKHEGDIVVALITAGGYQKVDTLPENAKTDVQCSIESAKQSSALIVECYELQAEGFSVHETYDPTLGNILHPVGYENLPEFIEELREDVRKIMQ
jgi:hypothetical protein